LAILVQLADPEIGEEGLAVTVKQYVAWLNVAMDDPAGVGFVQRAGQPSDDVHRVLQVQATIAQQIGQRAARHVTHDQERLAVMLAEVVNGDDGRMLEGGDDARFALEASTGCRLVAQITEQDLDRDIAADDGVVGQIDHRHAAVTQLGFDLITSNLDWFHQ
jgi:hypothetical protein